MFSGALICWLHFTNALCFINWMFVVTLKQVYGHYFTGKVFAHFMSLCHVLVVLSVFYMLSYYLLWSLNFCYDQTSLVAQMVKHLPTMLETWVQSLGQEDLEKEMTTHSSILAWKLPWKEEPGRLQSMGWQSQIQLSNFTFTFMNSDLPSLWRVCGTAKWYHFHFGL